MRGVRGSSTLEIFFYNVCTKIVYVDPPQHTRSRPILQLHGEIPGSAYVCTVKHRRTCVLLFIAWFTITIVFFMSREAIQGINGKSD